MTDESLPQETSQPKPAQKKAFSGKALASSRAFIILVGALLVAGIGGLLWWQHESHYQRTDNATLVGHVHPISPRVGGTITKVLVDDDQLVKAGDVLAVIDARDYEIALSQAKHQLQNAQAEAQTAFKAIGYTEKQAKSQITQASGTVAASHSAITKSLEAVSEANAAVQQAKANLNQQQASYQKALTDYQRYQRVNPDAVSAIQLDSIRTQLENAEAARNAAKASVEQAVSRLAQTQAAVNSSRGQLTQAKGVSQGAHAQTLQLDVVKSQYESAKAAVSIAEDAVRQAELNLSYTKIKAPVDGKVGRKTVEVGQRVQPGEPLMSVVGSGIWVVANYKETQLEHMRPGQPVTIEVDAFPHHEFTGHVDSFSPASGAQFALLPPENATGNFTKIVQRIPVKILLDPASVKEYDRLLVPGMSTLVSVDVSAKPDKSLATAE